MQVCVVQYSHRHGTDVNVYSTFDLAYQGTGELIKESIEEISEDKQRKVMSLLEQRDYVKAIEAWREFTNEDFEFLFLPVIGV